jgi:hypothetical protein
MHHHRILECLTLNMLLQPQYDLFDCFHHPTLLLQVAVMIHSSRPSNPWRFPVPDPTHCLRTSVKEYLLRPTGIHHRFDQFLCSTAIVPIFSQMMVTDFILRCDKRHLDQMFLLQSKGEEMLTDLSWTVLLLKVQLVCLQIADFRPHSDNPARNQEHRRPFLGEELQPGFSQIVLNWFNTYFTYLVIKNLKQPPRVK